MKKLVILLFAALPMLAAAQMTPEAVIANAPALPTPEQWGKYGHTEAFTAHKEHGYFTKEGYAIAGLEGKAVLINKSGRIILNSGYDQLSFYNDCRILKARKGSKVGIIDYQGNVLEPFVHNSFESESLAKAANRIFKEKGGEKVEIW